MFDERLTGKRPAFLNQVKLCLIALRRNGGALGNVAVIPIPNYEPLPAEEEAFMQANFSSIEFRTSPGWAP